MARPLDRPDGGRFHPPMSSSSSTAVSPTSAAAAENCGVCGKKVMPAFLQFGVCPLCR
jgi:hypothetical protein